MQHGGLASAKRWARRQTFGAVFNRQSVLEALRSAQQLMKAAPNKTSNGLALFCGGGVHELVEPPMPLSRPLYHCGKGFIVDALQKMVKCPERPSYGVIVIDGSEAVLASFTDSSDSSSSPSVKFLKRLTVQNQCRTRRGGMSALRMDRIRDEVEHGFVVRAAEACNDLFMDDADLGGEKGSKGGGSKGGGSKGGGSGSGGGRAVAGLVVAGPGGVKHLLAQSPALANFLRTRLVGQLVDTPRAGRSALGHAIALSAEALACAAAAPEALAMASIVDLVLRGEDGVEVVYGQQATLAALAAGACSSVVASKPLAEKTSNATVGCSAESGGGSGGGGYAGAGGSGGYGSGGRRMLKDEIDELCDSFGSTVVWVGSVHNAAYAQFEELGGFAARLRWPFKAENDEDDDDDDKDENKDDDKELLSNEDGEEEEEEVLGEVHDKFGDSKAAAASLEPVSSLSHSLASSWTPNPRAAEWVPSSLPATTTSQVN